MSETHHQLPILIDLLSIVPPVLVHLPSSTHDGLLEALGVFPSSWREVRVGFVGVFDEGLTRAGEVDGSGTVVDVL